MFREMFGGGKFGRARWVYFVVFAAICLLSWAARDSASFSHALNQINVGGEVCRREDDVSKCEGKETALRLSGAGVVFFALHAAMTLGVDSTTHRRACLHTDRWYLHAILLFLLTVTFLWVPSSVIRGYFEVARVLGAMFLVMQLLALLEFVYSLNEALLERQSRVLMVYAAFASIIMYLGALGVIGGMYHVYAPEPTCAFNIFLLTFTIMLAVVYTAISQHPKVDAGILTSGLVFGYTTFQTWSALQSLPASAECALESSDTPESLPTKVVTFIIVLGAVLVATMRAGGQHDLFEVYAADESLPYRCDFLHIIFTLGCAYISMLFTGWSMEGIMEQYELDRGWISVWMKIMSEWTAVLLYVWSMVAPVVCKNRDFSST
mmetsp:Transcript_47075/g.87734  ORF Transcript_47075/g.87734 Transcript_47075/m.87734 type:complete len:379 (+) Transcript_47075:251-1387(+)